MPKLHVKPKFSDTVMEEEKELVKKWLNDLVVVYGDPSMGTVNKYMVVLALAQVTLLKAMGAAKKVVESLDARVTIEVLKE